LFFEKSRRGSLDFVGGIGWYLIVNFDDVNIFGLGKQAE
jgi:hypothetical protein